MKRELTEDSVVNMLSANRIRRQERILKRRTHATMIHV